MLWRPPGAHLYGGGGRKYEIVPTSPDRVPVALGLSAGLVHSEKCEKIRNPTVGTWCFGRLPHPSPPYKMGGRRASRATLGRDHRMRWRASGSELASWECASDAPSTSFGRAVGEENECRGGYGSPTAHTNGGVGGDQNTTFPWSDSGFFHTFPSARAPPTIPVPRGLDPATLALFQNFDPRHHTKGPRRPPEHRHHQPPPPPRRIAPMAPLRVPGTGRRSQAAPSHLNTNLGPLSYHTPSRSTEIPSGGRKYTEIGL